MNKKKKHKFRRILTCLVLICALVCSSITPSFAAPMYKSTFNSQSFNKTREHSVTIHAGEMKLLSVLYIGASWSSSDRSVVTVKNGVITGVAPGTAIVTAKSWIFGTEKWNVTVKDENIKDKGNVSIKVDEKKLLSIVYLCADWTSTDNSIVTVKHGVITGKSEGEAIVTAKSLLLGSAKWTVTVESNEQHTEHIWNNGITTTPATCVNEGVITYTCTVCGETKTESIPIDPDNHEKIITDSKEPTCTEDGTETVKCDACGKVISETKLPATGHVWDQGTIVTEATCVKEGKVIFTCEKCGEKVEKTIPIDPQNHENVTTETTEPTCTEGGRKAEVCKDCGVVINETVLPAKGHTEAKEHKDPTETEDGYDRVVCSVCGEILSETIISATGHKWDDGVVTKEATCVEEGVITFICKDCKETYTKPIPIDPDNHANVNTKKTDPTCTEDGVEITYCADCGTEIKKTTIPAVGHDWKKNSTTAATCVTEGKIIYMCNNCGDTKEEAIPVDPDNHINVNTKETEPTCTEDGKITIFCSDCEKVLNEESIAATGHSWGDGTVTKEPTCVAKGEKTYTCANCGQTQTDVLPVDPDNHKNITTKTEEATCTEDGVTVTYCKDCNTVIKQETIPAKGHTEVKEHKDPTATEDGYDRVVCSVCGTVISETVIPATGETEPEENVVIDLVVKDGVVTDLVTGTTYPNITVSGDYMKSGTITLPKSYSNWTYQMIADYNEESSSGIIRQMRFTSNSGKYEECSNVFKLNEVSSISNRGSVVVPWVKDSWNSGYVVTIPVQIYSHVSADYEYLPTGDIFWSFSMDSDNGVLNSRIDGATATTTMSTYTASDETTKYVSKILPSSFALTGEHAVKEIKIYDRALTTDEQKAAYEATGIVPPTSGINDVLDGLTDMGSSFYFTREKGGYVTPLKSETEAGTYTVEDGNGRSVTYEIKDFVQPDNGIDNSVYESVHITNEPETLETGKQYPLTAYPYPYNITGDDGKADEFDVEWHSSDPDIITVIDGLLIAKKAGSVEITATLIGTDMSDTVTIKVENTEKAEEKIWNVPSDYVSSDGYSFSDSDYEMTTRAIYAAIDEATEKGYNHIVFPKQNFYAVPLTDKDGYAVRYYVPTNMTIEFPEGSAFYMMDNEVSRGDPTKIELHYFEFGVPSNDYTNTCEDSHLIIDTYYGERYNTTHSESEYLEELRFVNFGRKAVDCSVEIRNAIYPAGYFIVADGTSSTNKSTGVMTYGDFVSGWLDEEGQLQENSNWISTVDFITVPDYGEDGYFISADGQDSYAGKYWGGCSARQYDILWYDSNKTLISADRFQGRGEYYDIPDDAAYFKLSLQQSTLPTPGSNETAESPWIAMHDDGSAKMCEIKNTNVYNSATGVFSVVGETDGLWIHDCYTNRNGMKPANERTGDFENGWTAMRHSVVSNNSLNGYFGNPGGFNTFFHTNFLTNYSGFTGETEMLRYINNTTDYVEISEKAQAHIYYNTLYGVGVDRFNTSIGHIYQKNNKTGQWVRSY